MRAQDKNNNLNQVGVKVQLPCHVIDGKAVYESDATIEYAKVNLLQKKYQLTFEIQRSLVALEL